MFRGRDNQNKDEYFLNRLALYEQEPQKPEPIKWIGLGARERNVVGETIELFLHFVGKSNHCTTFTRRWMEIAIHTESFYRYRRSGFPFLCILGFHFQSEGGTNAKNKRERKRH